MAEKGWLKLRNDMPPQMVRKEIDDPKLFQLANPKMDRAIWYEIIPEHTEEIVQALMNFDAINRLG